MVPTIYLNKPNEEGVRAEALRLRRACIEVGFFYLEDHGISSEFIARVLALSKEFFQLPPSQKANCTDSVLNRGYTHMGEETLDPKNQPTKGDTKEGYYIGRDVPTTSTKFNPLKLSGPNVWPTPDLARSWTVEQCEIFQRTMEEYFNAMSSLGLKVVQLLALSLELPSKHFFDEAFAEPMAMLRLLHYSSEPSCPDRGIYGCGAQSDYGMITLLLTDEHPGLQIFTKEQKWVDVPPRKGAFIVNLGDMLERWTNGLYHSTVHRVIIRNPSATDNYCADEGMPTAGESHFNKGDRYSIPFFYEPYFDTEVRCLDVCCRDNDPRYPPVTSGEYLLHKYTQTHADFQSPNDTQ
jgi:isopenicillin N synthase-like dioxygenase